MRVRSQSQNIRISVIYLDLDPALSLQDCGYTLQKYTPLQYTLHSTPRYSTHYTASTPRYSTQYTVLSGTVRSTLRYSEHLINIVVCFFQ